MKPVEALNRLTEITTSFCISQAFLTACNLGLFEQLSSEEMTAKELSKKVNIHVHGCERLLGFLRHLGLVELEGDIYRNTDVSSFCTSNSPIPLDAMSLWCDQFYHMWEFLPEALREYSPQWQRALGTTAEMAFKAMYEDPVRLKQFVQLMNANSAPQGQVIAESFDFTPYQCILDVAGGLGGMIISIGQRYPKLRGIIMDLPPVCEIAEGYIQDCGLADRFTTAVADLFEGPYPAGADVINLAHVLHDWGDEKCHIILRHCFEALPSQGVLLVVEKVLNNDLSGDRHALVLNLLMLLVCEPGAKERSEAEYRTLLKEAGFRGFQLIRLEAPRDLIIVHKP